LEDIFRRTERALVTESVEVSTTLFPSAAVATATVGPVASGVPVLGSRDVAPSTTSRDATEVVFGVSGTTVELIEPSAAEVDVLATVAEEAEDRGGLGTAEAVDEVVVTMLVV
jgi:hypothetical protein